MSIYHLVFGDEGKKRNIAAVLYDYIGKSLKESDGIHYGICEPCWQQLIQYKEFKEKCIRANEVSSDENDGDCDDVNTSSAEENEFMQAEYVYEDSEYLDESQNDSDYEMNVEYLEESDTYDEDLCERNAEIERKKLSEFDFTTILVKPIFVLEIGKQLTVTFGFFLLFSIVLLR